MIVRLGLPKSTGEFPGAAERLEAPVLISANSLWDNGRKQFRIPGSAIDDLDVALDSAGFVAMNLYGSYRWSVEQYVSLAERLNRLVPGEKLVSFNQKVKKNIAVLLRGFKAHRDPGLLFDAKVNVSTQKTVDFASLP